MIQLPAEMNAIRVMTIHKSKGLEFGAVIIPFCDWKVDHDANKNIIWCKTEKRPFNNTGYLPLRYSKELAKSYFAPEYFQEKINAAIDNLNLLYVALTRAEKHLIINCPPKSRERLTTAGDLMLLAIDHLQKAPPKDLEVGLSRENEECVSYQIGNVMNEKATQEKESSVAAGRDYRSSDWRQKIAIRKKGSDYFDIDFSERKERINFGILVHDILAKSQREEDVERLLEQSLAEGSINQKERQTLIEQLQMIFANPEVKRWFDSRRAEVKVEVPIITNEKTEKRPDRVLIEGKKATVIDFKTGSEASSHKKQVMLYRSLLLKMGYEKVDAFLLYISQNKVLKIA
jgi:ATP-dependent exoDNAse (exonuclease V) beta subunit